MSARRMRPRGVLLAAALLAGALAPQPVLADPDDYAAVERGRALATAADCVACHTAPGGVPFAGGLGLETPFGTIMSPNITPDDGTGLGHWTRADFARAMHDGVRPNGAHLYPAFPYPYYTRLTRQDTDAIFAFLRTLPPSEHVVNRDTLPFPFSIRASMVAWNALFLMPGPVATAPRHSAEYDRGAYLVEAAGHCGACHTPMNLLGASRDARFLQGNRIDDWTAPNITNDARQGLGSWSVQDVVEYLRTGHNRVGMASGPMAEVVAYSTSHMPESDLRAMAVFLKERGAAGSPAPVALPASDPTMQAGAAIYADTCSACHERAGVGVPNIFPRLAGNPDVLQDDTATLVRVVLAGARGAATDAAPTAPAMPSLGFRLDDAQVAAVLTFIRNSWGNSAPAVSASEVRSLRGVVGLPRER